ncbi:UDP-glycosyltransferase 83A1-like [Nymphaea colorata]|nr:UDP-glycosyltransferase 83A1-like [Nymphaea colorata]
MATPHALVIPFYGQGHVAPLMDLSHHLADHGVLVTFVYTEYVHRHVTAALPENFCSDYVGRIRLASIPDGLASDEDRQDLYKVFSAISNTMPSFLEELIQKLHVAKKLNLPRAAFWPASSWTLATVLNIPKLIVDGIIDQNGKFYPPANDFNELHAQVPISENFGVPTGFLTGNKLVRFSEGLPAHLCWVPFGDAKQQRIFFKYLQSCGDSVRGLSHILCNTFEELE